jgi:AraC-like DNA-binding protein
MNGLAQSALATRSSAIAVRRLPSASHRPTLLVVDADPGLQATLAVLLEHRADVRGTCSLSEATEQFGSGSCSKIVLIADRLLESELSNAGAERFFDAVRSRATCCLTVLLVDPDKRCDRVTPFAMATVAARPFAMDRLLRRLDDLLRTRGEPDLWEGRMSVHVGRGLAFLARHYGRAPTLEEISSAVCLSPSRLAHLFRAETGKSPKNYLARMRVEVAKRALLESDEKLDTVAERLGFCDAPHFSRVFHQYVGTWPGDFRRSAAGAFAA